ncbi:MAG: hypothetical protein V9E87_04265 [Gemmatimonadales bacterium]
MLHPVSRAGLALLALLPAMLSAQDRAAPTGGVDPGLFQGLRYRLVGPSRGGRVTTVTGVPSEPRTFYMGVASGGVFKTTDGGERWVPITDGQVPLGSTGSIAVAESDPKVVYLGTGSDGLRSNVSTGRGVYRSPDAGATWQFAGLREVGQIGAVRIHPRDPNTLWVAANGDAFKPSPNRGIYKSTDAGKSWQRTLFLTDSSGAMDVELQPGNPDVVYAWLSRIERKPWTIISGAREGGFYRSTDGGTTWTHITAGLPTDLIGKGNLAVTAANPRRIYALVEAKPGGGLYRSDDAGLTWNLMNANSGLVQRPFYYTTLGADPTNADVVYAGAESFYKSVDGGKTLTTMRTPHGDNHDIWINPTNGQTMIQSNDGGANISFDGGRTWSTQLNQPTAEIYGVWMDNAFPYNLYGAQQDNSTVRLSSQSVPRPARGTRQHAGLRDRADHPASGRSEHHLRLVQGAVQRDGPAHRPVEELLDRRAVAVRQPRLRPDLAHAARLADGALAARSVGALLRLTVPAPHPRSRRDLGDDLPRPHRQARLLPGRERRADHARRDGRGVLQHALRDHRVADRAWRDLDRRQRRPDPRDARQRKDLDQRDAEGPPDRRPRAVDRGVADPTGRRLRGRVSLSARRLCAVLLPDHELRPQLEEDRERDPG